MLELPISGERLLSDIAALATFTEPATPGWTRRAFSPAFSAGRAWLAERMRAAGLAAHTDAAGNLVGRRPGRHDLPPLVIGSHTDTVLGAGRFDGMLGVLAGLEVARALGESGSQLAHPLEVIDFLAEEPTAFGASCVGSMALAGALTTTQLGWCDPDGRTLAEAIESVGGRPAHLADVRRRPGQIAAYIELHIEQGPVLEAAGTPLAAVTGIVGIRRADLCLRGRQDHAGTAPMRLRHDALAAAAATVLAVEQQASEVDDAVGTVGALRVAPGQQNVVPGQVDLTLDVRGLDDERLAALWERIVAAATQAAAQRGVVAELSRHDHVVPVRSPAWLIDLLAGACDSVAPGTPRMPSGAGHDGSWIGQLAPVGMIFVRSIGGRSHCPEEESTPTDIALGARALGEAVLRLDRRTQEAA